MKQALLQPPKPLGPQTAPRHCFVPKPAAEAENLLLTHLSAEEKLRWLTWGEAIELPRGEVLFEPNCTPSHVYFPTTAVISWLYVTEDGASTEVAMVGKEGMVGLSALMEGESAPCRAVVQCGGQGIRFRAQLLRDEFSRAGTLMQLMLRYTQAFIAQMAQMAVCNRHHSLDRQLCRWLLLSLDRRDSSDLALTQEYMASMLGVRREGVTESALKLQAAGLIRYTRGRISVLDRHGLEARACECYAVVRKEYERLLPARHATVAGACGAGHWRGLQARAA